MTSSRLSIFNTVPKCLVDDVLSLLCRNRMLIFMKTEDRRVRKTKRALQEGLAELLLETNLRKITVRELTDKVDIHRATFYAHYKDIYDLYEQIENTVFDELSKIIVRDPSHKYDDIFKVIIDYIHSNSKICRMFISKNGNHSFYNRISTFLEEQYFDIWKYETNQIAVTEELQFLIKYHIQGCLAIVSRWAESNYSYPKDKLADIILNVDINFDKILY